MDMDSRYRPPAGTESRRVGQLLALWTSQLLTLSVVPQATEGSRAHVGPSTKSTVAHSV